MIGFLFAVDFDFDFDLLVSVDGGQLDGDGGHV
jgi:hypothetical protein